MVKIVINESELQSGDNLPFMQFNLFEDLILLIILQF